MKFTSEMLAKAKMCKSAEELLVLAKEVGVELTEDEAKEYFAKWHGKKELAEDELEQVSGGSFMIGDGTYSSDYPHRLIVVAFNSCNMCDTKSYFQTCANCSRSMVIGPTRYCKIRTSTKDPYNSEIGGREFYWGDGSEVAAQKQPKGFGK